LFKVTDGPVPLAGNEAQAQTGLVKWTGILIAEAKERKAEIAKQKSLGPTEIESLARQVFEEVKQRAVDDGTTLPDDLILRLIGELSGLGTLLELIARDDAEDVAINLGHIYLYTTSEGWTHVGPVEPGTGSAIRVLIDRAGETAPTPDSPIADAMLQVMLPASDGTVRRKGIRVNFIMPPASPYGDTITLRVIKYGDPEEAKNGLAGLCETRLPPVRRPAFVPVDFPRGNGVMTPEVANYLLAVMVKGGTIIVAGTTGSGKTYIAQRLLQSMLNYYPPGSLRLFIVEDSNEIVLNGWNGSPNADTGNVVYTTTRPERREGPPQVSMYDLIKAALRSRPHGLVIGEARGAEAWEFVKATATGHGHSTFTLHATSAEHVWARFLQIAQSHEDAARLDEYRIATSFADAVTTIIYVERHPEHGQVVREVLEVSPIVERAAGRPAFLPLFKYAPSEGALLPTGHRPVRPGYRPVELGIPEGYFTAKPR
jgi:Flp pilus assembly CpaF family ATPase